MIIDIPNREVIRNWYNMQNRNLVAPECIWEIAAGFPYGGTYTNSKAVFEEFFPRLLESFEQWRVEVEEILDANSIGV